MTPEEIRRFLDQYDGDAWGMHELVDHLNAALDAAEAEVAELRARIGGER